MIKLFQPYVPNEAIEQVSKVLCSPCITQGSKVDLFEWEFASLFKVANPVSVNSGTSALEIAYDLIGLKKGDEVITTPLTCAATNIPLLHRKVKIVWADVLPDTLCIDPLDVRSKFTNKTKAVVQVHLGGVGADVGKVHVPVVSDACQALGIFTGDYTCCSFQAIKHITTGDGGMLVVNDIEKYHKAKLMRWFGIDRGRQIPNEWQSYRTRMMNFDIEVLGGKKHMNDINATLGLVGLSYYNAILSRRQELFTLYRSKLQGVDGIKIVDGKINACWLFTLLVERRDDFAKMLFDANVETNVVNVRNDVYKIFGGKKADLPVLDSIYDKYICLPIGMHIKEEDVEYICDKIRKGW
jgi:dTDP-4-amino-4,6-dideoxygalactose transaminase